MRPEAPRRDWQSTQTETGVLMRLQAGTAADLDASLPSMLDRAFKGQL